VNKEQTSSAEKKIDVLWPIFAGLSGVIALIMILPTFLVGFFWCFFLVTGSSFLFEKEDNLKKILYLVLNSLAIVLLTSIGLRLFLVSFGLNMFAEYSFITQKRYETISFFTLWGGLIISLAGSVYLMFFKDGYERKKSYTLKKASEFASKTPFKWYLIGVFFVLFFGFFFSPMTNDYWPMLEEKFKIQDFYLLKVSYNFPFSMSLKNWCLSNIGILSVLFLGLNFVIFELILGELEPQNGSSQNSIKELIRARSDIKGIEVGRMNGKKLYLNDRDINHHIHVLGQTGAGKSVLLRNIYSQKIINDEGVVLIDLKGEMELKNEFRGLCEASDREEDLGFFDINDLKNSFHYNPFVRGNATELKDKMMMAFEWSESYYKFVADSFLINIFNAFVIVRDELGELPTLRDLFNCANDPKSILKLASKLPENQEKIKEDLENIFENLNTKDGKKELKGISSQLETMVKSEYGELLCSSNTVDLLDLMLEKKVIHVMLDEQRYGETAKRIARFLLTDIRSCSGHIVSQIAKEKRPKVAVIIDEFSSIVTTEELGEMATGLLNRSRSSGIGLILAHQSLGDFATDRVKTRIIDNTETLISFVQKDDESAEKIAKMVGTKSTEKKTFQIEKTIFGERKLRSGSSREVEEFLIHPNKIKDLGVGKAIYFAKKPTRIGELSVRYLDLSSLKISIKSLKSRVKAKNFKPYFEVEIDEKMKSKYLKKAKENEAFNKKLSGTLNKNISLEAN
jgi:hypothetical protein